jgi:plastocyanin
VLLAARSLIALLLLAGGATGGIRGRITVKQKDGADKPDSSEVVVYLMDVNQPVSGVRAQIRQQKQQFTPRVLAVAVGTEVDFPNDDLLEHNVFSHSANADFDLGRYGRGKSKAVTLSKPGVAEVFCNVHKNMVGYVLVAPSRHFAVTRADGTFELAGVPAGRHKLALWDRFARPKLTEIVVDVHAGRVAKVERQVVEAVEAEPPHKNKFGVDYGGKW